MSQIAVQMTLDGEPRTTDRPYRAALGRLSPPTGVPTSMCCGPGGPRTRAERASDASWTGQAGLGASWTGHAGLGAG